MSSAWVWIIRKNSKGQEESSGFPASELDALRRCLNIVAAYEGSLSDINHLAVIRDCDLSPEWKSRERVKAFARMRPLAVQQGLNGGKGRR